MDRLRNDVVQRSKGQEKARGNGRWWRWPLFGCGGLFGLLFVLAFIGLQLSQNQAQEIIELGKTNKDQQLTELAEANNSVLEALEKLSPELAKAERERREINKVKTEAAAEKQKTAKAETEYREMLEREIKSMRESSTIGDVDDSEEDEIYITVNAALIATRAKLLEEAPSDLPLETKELQAEFVRLHKTFQRKAFPKLRRIQAKIWREKLWKNDVDVRTTGGKADGVIFTAGMFAANRNKQAAHDAALETLKLLRFNRDIYEWHRGSTATYWDLEPFADDEIATVDSENNWRPIKL